MHLEFRSISFAYGRKGLLGSSPTPVLRDFSWRVPSGRTVILGPNGAGKTTLLALGASALRPSSGQVRLGDLSSTDRRHVKQFRRAVGWMPQQTHAVPGLTAREQVAYAGWLKGMPHSVAWRGAEAALQRVDLLENANRLATQLSGGQQRRVALAQLLVHRAEVLLLDEPTAGLDPGQRGKFRDTLRLVSEHGPVVVSTHQVDDLTELFDTVVVINSGSVVFEGSVAAFLDHAPSGIAQRAETAYGHFIAGER